MNSFNPGLFQSEIAWAFASYYRWWLMIDGGWLARIESHGMTAATVSNISREYSVSRTISGNQEDGLDGAGRIAESINSNIAEWPSTLGERAIWCANVASKAQSTKLKTSRDSDEKKRVISWPVSAVTKLVWFLRPQGWTVFDSYAARAMGLNYGTAALKMIKFYERLEAAEFVTAAERINTVLAPHNVLAGLGGRVIDQLLVYRGSDDSEQREFRERTAGFLGCLPTTLRSQTIEIANTLAAQVGSDIMRTPETGWPQKRKALRY